MNNYTTTVLAKKEFVDSTQTTMKIHRNNKHNITPTEIQMLTKNLLEKAPKNTKLRIRGLGIDSWHNLKTFDDDLNVQDYDEYYKGKVKDTGKFTNFSQIEMVFIKPK